MVDVRGRVVGTIVAETFGGGILGGYAVANAVDRARPGGRDRARVERHVRAVGAGRRAIRASRGPGVLAGRPDGRC